VGQFLTRPVKTLPPRLSSPIAAGSASAPAPHAPWAKIGLVSLDFTGKEPGFLHRHRHLHHSAPQALTDPLAGLEGLTPASLLDVSAGTSAQNIFNNSLNFRLRNPCIENVSVCHCPV
jgi:hypothetical protein